jgi:sialate O-acetylesterase
MKRMLFAALTVLSAGVLSVQAKVSLAPVFCDNMVLQRELPAAVWGAADPQEEVTVAFAGQSVKAQADEKGAWKLRLQPLAASKENRALTASGKDSAVTVNNVLVGEVWLCSGQSNMEQPLWGGSPQFRDGNGAMIAALADYPFIRVSRVVPYGFSVKPRTDFAMSWTPVTPQTAGAVSAAGFYFGTELYRALDIPIGLITSHWGGTRIEPWTPPCGFESVPALKGILDSLPNLKDNDGTAKNLHQQPTVLYNRMLVPFVPFAMRGAIWYQGEANLGDGAAYADKMRALLNGWKTVFENPGFKLYFAQLAPFIYGGDGLTLPVLWEAQQKFADEESDAGMAVINDVGDLHDIHPRQKEMVGRRLAVLALNRDYGFKNVVADSPALKDHTVENGKFVLAFNHVKQFYTPGRNIPAKHFEVAGADGKFIPAVCELKGDRLIVGAEGVAEPRQLRYLWNQTCEGNLYNEGCLPLGAFRIQAK